MTEDWAVRPPNEEEEKEINSELANASEEEAPNVTDNNGFDGDESGPAQIDKRTASERFSEESEGESEEEKEDDAAVAPAKEEKEAETDDDNIGNEKTAREKGMEWLDEIPEKHRNRFKGMQTEAIRLRDRNKKDRQDYERKLSESTKTIKEEIAQGFKDSQPKPEIPDKDIYPEEYAQHMEGRANVADEELEHYRNAEKQRQDAINLGLWMGRQEDDDPDFLPAFNYLKQSIIQENINKGESEEKSEEIFQDKGNELGRQLMERDGDWTTAVKFYADQYGYKKENGTGETVKETTEEKTTASGEDIAKAVTAGMKSAKSLGASSGVKAGDLTSKDIAGIEDPDEHATAFKKWEQEQIGGNADWK